MAASAAIFSWELLDSNQRPQQHFPVFLSPWFPAVWDFVFKGYYMRFAPILRRFFCAFKKVLWQFLRLYQLKKYYLKTPPYILFHRPHELLLYR